MKSSLAMKLVSAAWLSIVVVVMLMIMDYSVTPGRAGVVPAQWPVDSQLPLDASRPTLVMFAHPHCPCTRASIGELAVLMANCRGKLSAKVVFIKPEGFTDDWVKTDEWQTAAAIPGVTVAMDEQGREARRFQAETSGETVLYDQRGHLLFQGGITITRGHSGDNPGRSAMESLLLEGTPSGQTQTAVYGCALFDSANPEGGAVCKL